ncbi:methyltransferase [Methanobacterium alcaliphilum]|uniref:methyltransferase n=1 Tax=Methanobacterium alcaliphilum TaxID=392018 RepID=UPI00200B58A7|nr:class I SAM-dependent methyltransferase [Methanobacterium alcaliphilum]MCK9150402.1 methyltransferase [Methanobacterium alcaliphilum]
MSHDNTTPYISELYDAHVINTLPYYASYHQETINLIKSLPEKPKIWMDTGCGTGSLITKALRVFPKTQFLLLDPSEGMIDQAQKKFCTLSKNRIKFLDPSPTQDFSQKLDEKVDVITAIQCHHYLSKNDRKKAVNICHDLLKDRGVFVTFENIRPLTENGVEIGKAYWKNFQLEQGKDEEEIDAHLARFDVEYFPITVEDHLTLLRESGFRLVEILWYSYLQAGFYCIK